MSQVVALAVNPTMRNLLTRHPSIPNKALAGVVDANMPPSSRLGSVKVTDKMHPFTTAGIKHARVIYFSPYGYFRGIRESIKRFFVGVSFRPIDERNIAEALKQGRRYTVIVASDGSEAEGMLEQNRKPCRLVQSLQHIFSSCIYKLIKP